MKTFLFKLSLAVVAVIPYFLVLVLVHKLDKRDYIDLIKLPPGKSVVVTSDSQTECSLNPEYYPELANYSYSAISLKRVFTKFRDLVAHNPGQIKVFILDVSPMKLCNVKDPRLKAEDPMVRTLSPGWKDWLTGTLLKYLIGQSKERLFQRNRCSTHPFAGGYNELRIQGYVTHPQMAATIEKQTSETFNSYPLLGDDLASQLSAALVCQMIEYAKTNNIQVVLMTAPQSKGVKEKFDPQKIDRFIVVMNMISNKYGVVWLNYLDLEFCKEEWGDPLHINYLAARKFSERVRADISRATSR